MPDPIAIAGAGRMGQALARLLRERGESISAVASRSPDHARDAAAFIGGGPRASAYHNLPQQAKHILIAVPDDAIGVVACTLAEAGMCAGVALHTSGAHGPQALAPLAAAGVACGTLHPLQTVASPEEGVRVLPGCAFAVDGDGEATNWAGHIAHLLGGQVLRIPAAARPLYHAAAVIASNYLTALLSSAVILMREAGVEEATARHALEPLARVSVENALRLPAVRALTGPIARGDLETVRAHLAALAHLPAAGALYRAAGLATLEIARERGLAESQAAAIAQLLRKG